MAPLQSLPEGLLAAIACRLGAPDKASLRLCCRALRPAVNATVTAVEVGRDLALPGASVFPRLTSIVFDKRASSAISDEQLRSWAPSLSALPSLTSVSTPSGCRASRASLQALAAACPQLRALEVDSTGGRRAHQAQPQPQLLQAPLACQQEARASRPAQLAWPPRAGLPCRQCMSTRAWCSWRAHPCWRRSVS